MANGINVNEVLTAVGRFKEVKRTTGISTTDITGKLLRLVEENPENKDTQVNGAVEKFSDPPK